MEATPATAPYGVPLNFVKRVLYTRLLGTLSDSLPLVEGVLPDDRTEYMGHIRDLTKQFAAVLMAMDE